MRLVEARTRERDTTSSVSITEKRLPADIRREWARLVSSDSSSVDKKNKFPGLLKFCSTRKGQSNMIYQICECPELSEVKRANSLFIVLMQWLKILKKTSSSLLKARVALRAYFTIVPATEPMNANYTYPRLVVSEWTSLEKGVHVGPFLKIGHCLHDCRSRKACGENGCTRTHHRTLHEENREASVSVTASSCGDPSSDTCLLLLQRVRTGKDWANVMWDNAASLSFITNSKAKAEMLYGTRVEIFYRQSYVWRC